MILNKVKGQLIGFTGKTPKVLNQQVPKSIFQVISEISNYFLTSLFIIPNLGQTNFEDKMCEISLKMFRPITRGI